MEQKMRMKSRKTRGMMRKTPKLRQRMTKTYPARSRRMARMLGTRRMRRRVMGKTLQWMRSQLTLLQRRMLTCDRHRSAMNKQYTSVQMLHNWLKYKLPNQIKYFSAELPFK